MKAEPNIADAVWIGEARWAKTGRWYTLYSTCQPTRRDAGHAIAHHPQFQRFDKTRIKKFTRKTGPHVIVELAAKEAEALGEACGFREAGETSDLSGHQYAALMRAFRKLREASLTFACLQARRKGEKKKP